LLAVVLGVGVGDDVRDLELLGLRMSRRSPDTETDGVLVTLEVHEGLNVADEVNEIDVVGVNEALPLKDFVNVADAVRDNELVSEILAEIDGDEVEDEVGLGNKIGWLGKACMSVLDVGFPS
jgi:hypothetical protein